MTKKFQFYVAGIFVVMALTGLQGLACSCISLDESLETQVQRALKAADAVFAGEVINVSEQGKRKSVEMNLITLWKGELTGKVNIFTPTDSAACGIDFTVGEKYLVYASVDANNPSDQRLNAWLCSRTRSLSKRQADIPYLGKEKKIGKSSPKP